MTRNRNWVYTINNPSDDDEPKEWAGVKYGVYQLEVGEEGTKHLQGYVAFSCAKSLSQVKLVNGRAHWEPRRGSHEQARAYCMKDDTRAPGSSPVEWGTPPASQGKRTDIMSIKSMVDSGLTDSQIAEAAFGLWCRHHRAIQEYRRLVQPARDWEAETIVFYGPPGTGKSRRALALAGPDAFWVTGPNSAQGAVWWDGYQGQETVVIDEFYGWIPRNFMNRLCDRYKVDVQVKGATANFRARRIIITSNKHPRDWWPRSGLGAMERRLTAPMGGCLLMDHPCWTPESGDPHPFKCGDGVVRYPSEIPPHWTGLLDPLPGAGPPPALNGFE